MKKIFFSILLAGALLTSCDMNLSPAGQLDDEAAIQNQKDALRFRNGIYNNIRTMTAGDFVYNADMQADMFIGTQINGNRLGPISLGNINSSDTDLERLWSYPYKYIAATNYFFEKVEAVISNESTSADDRIQLQRYRGEAHWARAFYYYYLADHYCAAYSSANAGSQASGMPLVTKYAPSGNYGSYPGRSTLEETYALIEQDLNDAYADLSAFEASSAKDAKLNRSPNAPYLSTHAVAALHARVALLKGDYATAIAKAEQVINSGVYKLCGIDDYPYVWTADQGDELIFVPYANQGQSGGVISTGEAWINADVNRADYLPGANALSMYDAENDVRYACFFNTQALTVNGANIPSPTFVKYPGNPELNTGSKNDLKNLPKPLRLSEQYLIVAEAAAESGNTVKANEALNALRKARIAGYTDENYSGQTLVNEVRAERTKELIGEGFRISDLRRWGLGFSRSANYGEAYPDVPGILVGAGINVSYQPGDYRLILPIPTAEMETNPQLDGQQNPGY